MTMFSDDSTIIASSYTCYRENNMDLVISDSHSSLVVYSQYFNTS